MGTRFFIGNKSGVGPVMKVMADAAYDPLSTPNTDYHKYLFNSEVQELAYAYDSYAISWANTYWTSKSANNWYYEPSGRTSSNCDLAVYMGGSTALIYVTFCFDRLSDLSYRSMVFHLRDRSNWLSNWSAQSYAYPGSSDTRYASFDKNIIDTTDRATFLFGVDLGRGCRSDDRLSSNYHLNNTTDNSWFQHIGLTYSTAATPIETGFIETELPVENDPYPSVVGSFVANKKILKISPTVVKLAKPGYDVDTATQEQLILSSDKVPMKIARAGSFTLAAGATTNIDIDYPITTKALVMDQVNVTGQGLRLPPYPDNNTQEIKLEHRIVGQQLQYRNQSAVSLDCRFFVLTEDGSGTSSGSAKVVENFGSYTQIRRPGSNAQYDKDVLLDTRCASVPIVAQGWVPVASITAGSDVARYGTHVYSVSLSNSGFKPLVLAQAKYALNNAPGKHVWQGFFAKNIEIYSQMSASTFMATITDTQVKFYVDKTGSRYEDAYRIGSYYLTASRMTLVGFRYYIFAIPNSL